MGPSIYHRLAILSCCMLLFGAWGCEEQAEAPPPQPKVVAQKITAAEPPKAEAPAPPQTAEAKKDAPAAQPAATPKTTTAAESAKPSGSESPAKAPSPQTAAGTETPTLPAGTGYAADAVTQTVKIDVRSTMADLTEQATSGGASLYRARFYIPEGKIDPFAPIFQQSEQEQAPVATSKKKRSKRAPQTPLERISLDQLTLVGIIRKSNGNRAIVQEASGKGYVVKAGTYIGTNAGRVIGIEKDRVLIQEEVENLLGDTVTRKQELTLKKPLGEE